VVAIELILHRAIKRGETMKNKFYGNHMSTFVQLLFFSLQLLFVKCATI